MQVRHRAHKARLYPAPAQLQKLDQQGHTARALWNLLHEWHGWSGPGGSIAKRPSPQEMDRQLRDARSRPLPGWEWLAQLPAQASQQVLRQYLRAWARYYSGASSPPRFKGRTARMSIDNPQAADLRVVRVNRRWGEVTVLLVGRVRFRWTRPLPVAAEGGQGRITGSRLVRNSLGWHICIRIQEPVVAVAPREGPAVGIDFGVVHTMAFSDGAEPRYAQPPESRRGASTASAAAQGGPEAPSAECRRPTVPSGTRCASPDRRAPGPADASTRGLDPQDDDPGRPLLRSDRGRGPEHRRDDSFGSWYRRVSGQERRGQGRTEPCDPRNGVGASSVVPQLRG
jgi:Helix-turn-helix domain